MSRISRIGIAASLFIATSGAAHDPASERPWHESDDWRFVAFSEGRSQAVFLSGLISRAGSAVEVETLTISRDPHPEYRIDQEHEHYLVDCGTLVHLRTLHQGYLPEGPYPPSLMRIQQRSAPASGTILRRVLDMACGNEVLPADGISDPYVWAKAQFGRSR